MIPSPALRFFVYGTLKPGYVNYQRYCAGKVIDQQPAIALGHLYALPVGYPAMTSGNTWIKGWLLSFTDPTVLQILDKLEGYNPQQPEQQNHYQRQQTPVFAIDQSSLGSAWCYFMCPRQIQQMAGILLPKGEWSAAEFR